MWEIEIIEGPDTLNRYLFIRYYSETGERCEVCNHIACTHLGESDGKRAGHWIGPSRGGQVFFRKLSDSDLDILRETCDTSYIEAENTRN